MYTTSTTQEETSIPTWELSAPYWIGTTPVRLPLVYRIKVWNQLITLSTTPFERNVVRRVQTYGVFHDGGEDEESRIEDEDAVTAATDPQQ